jgi:protein-L-isoaspartate(D-aspartate) O-methyltransferase
VSRSADLHAVQRAGMVRRLKRDGITDARVLDAMASVPRERFVPPQYAAEAYSRHPVPLGCGQTISAPNIVAIMAAALRLDGTDDVLEVGTGAGHAAAVLSRCPARVVTIERHSPLADRAREVLADLGYDNVEVRLGDGALGAPDRAPFTAISVAAMSADDVPSALVAQLAPHGRLICPVGRGSVGDLVLLHRDQRRVLLPVAFVPLVTDTGNR